MKQIRINQARISEGASSFKKEYLNKFNCVEAYDIYQPIVFFGMYDKSDYAALDRFIHKKVIVWCGTDSTMLDNNKAKYLKGIRATHIVKSKFMSDDLKKFDIPHKIIPVSWQDHNIYPVSLGDNIYHYGKEDYYGTEYLDTIEKTTGLYIIRTTKDTYSKEELRKIYQKCFIGLRLTKHDGLPNTVLELGMMGRRCIYNGGIPTSIKWNNLEDITYSIMEEYQNRLFANTIQISKEIKDYINIGEEWLWV